MKKERTKFEQMKSDKRTLHKRNYLIKKNGSIAFQRRFLELSPYEFMLEKQNFVCAICKKPDPTGRALAIDHDHDTDEVRGLLCCKCNRGLGLFCDSSNLLSSAVEYLKKYGK